MGPGHNHCGYGGVLYRGIGSMSEYILNITTLLYLVGTLIYTVVSVLQYRRACKAEKVQEEAVRKVEQWGEEDDS